MVYGNWKSFKIMSKIIFVLLLLLVLVAGCSTYTFDEGFKQVKSLDDKYGTSYSLEMLNGSVIKFESINPLITDLQFLKQESLGLRYFGESIFNKDLLVLFDRTYVISILF